MERMCKISLLSLRICAAMRAVIRVEEKLRLYLLSDVTEVYVNMPELSVKLSI